MKQFQSTQSQGEIHSHCKQKKFIKDLLAYWPQTELYGNDLESHHTKKLYKIKGLFETAVASIFYGRWCQVKAPGANNISLILEYALFTLESILNMSIVLKISHKS